MTCRSRRCRVLRDVAQSLLGRHLAVGERCRPASTSPGWRRLESSSWTSAELRHAAQTSLRLPTSKDWMNTGSVRVRYAVGPERGAAAPRAAGRSIGSTSGAWSRDRCRSSVRLGAASMTSARGLLASVPGTARRDRVLRPHRPGCAPWRAASCSSASVKSSVNQPVIGSPSIVLVVLRPANSGWSATSVVARFRFRGDDQDVVLGRDEVGLDEVGAPWASRTTRSCARAGSRAAPRCP